MVQEALLLFTVGIPSPVPALWFQFPLLTTHCSGSSTLSPRCLRDAPNSHCNIPAARLNHCLTEPILQTSGKAKAASACNRGAGSTGGAGCNCLFKPVRDPHFLTEGTGAEAMRLRPSQWGMRRSVNAWRLSRSTGPLTCFPQLSHL